MSAPPLPLFAPARHRGRSDAPPLSDEEARSALGGLVQRLEEAVLHTQAAPTARTVPDLYDGLAGALYALLLLHNAGFSTSLPLEALAGKLMRDCGGPSPTTSQSLLVGPTGVSFVAAQIGVVGARDAFFENLKLAADRGPMEFLYGPPGRALAAAACFRHFGEARFADLYCSTLEPLLRGRRTFARQVFAGEVRRYLGAAHGVAGVVNALLAGEGLWIGPEREEVLGQALLLLEHSAVHDEKRSNWPVEAGSEHLVQWCHGAPGILLALQGLSPGAASALNGPLGGGARLILEAGPLTKGPGFCHGTAGNALAILSLARRPSNKASPPSPPARAAGAERVALRGSAASAVEPNRLEREGRRLMASALEQLAQTPRRPGAPDELNLYEGPPGIALCLLSLLGVRPLSPPGLEGSLPTGEPSARSSLSD